MLPVMLAECDSCNTSWVADATCCACALDVIDSIGLKAYRSSPSISDILGEYTMLALPAEGPFGPEGGELK